ncbi:MAG TPA: caspase family protein [Oculatellaceae cyanobacterium]
MRLLQKFSLVACLLLLQNPVFAAGWMDSDSAHMVKGKSLYQSGQMDAAIAEFSGAIQANPRLAEAYYWRGIIFSTLKQDDRAQADFDSAISLDRSVPAFYMARATLYGNQNKHELAIADYDAVLRLEPYNQEAQTNRKFSQQQLNNPTSIASAAGASSGSATSSGGGSAGGAPSGEALPKPKYGDSATDRAIEKALAKQNGQTLKKLHDEEKARDKAADAAARDQTHREIAERIEREQQERRQHERELEALKRQSQVALLPSDSQSTKIGKTTKPESQSKAKTKSDTKAEQSQTSSVASAPPVKTAPPQTPTQEIARIQNAATNVSDVNRPIKDKWALVVGISKFKNDQLNLRYPSKDAKDFYDYLVSKENFAPDHVKLLTDKQATRKNIMTLLGDKWLPNVANPDDLVVIYISSHGSGAEMDHDGVNYLVAYDTDVNELYATGLPMQDLSSTVKRRVHSDRVVMILDACHSGAASVESKGLTRGSNVDADAIAQGTGQLVISSSKPDQVSWESKADQNSVFTRCLMDGLQCKGANTSLDDAFEYMKDSVQSEVLKERGVLQTPVLSSKWQGTGLMLGVKPAKPRPGLDVELPPDDDAKPNIPSTPAVANTSASPRTPVAAGVTPLGKRTSGKPGSANSAGQAKPWPSAK